MKQITNSVAKKLHTILISLLIWGTSYVYADCPSVKAIQNSTDKRGVISDDGSKWSSNKSLQEVKIGAVFSKATAAGVLIADEEGRPRLHRSLSTVSCEYTTKATSEIKCEVGQNNACVFTLEPASPLALNQCNIRKPELDPEGSPWRLNTEVRWLYANAVNYDCNPKNNLVSDCPFSFETYSSSKPNVEGSKQVAQSDKASSV